MSMTTDGNVNNNMKDGDRSELKVMSKEAEQRMNRVYRRMFGFLLLDLIAFTIILPILPSLLKVYGKEDQSGLYSLLTSISSGVRNFLGIEEEKAESVILGGIVNSLFCFLQFMSSPIIGAASDIYGRRRMMLVCMTGVALSYVLWIMSRSFLLFMLARFVGGISKGNVNLCMSMVTDVSNKEKRGRGMAMIGIAFSVGFLIGPMLGAVFTVHMQEGDKGVMHTYPALFAFTLAALDIVLIYFFMEETLPEYKRVQDKSYIMENAGKLINPRSIFFFQPVKKLGMESKASVQKLGLIYFIYMFVYSGVEFTLPFLMSIRFNWTSMGQGKMFFVLGIIMISVQGGYTRRIKAENQRKAAVRGMMMLFPSFLILTVSSKEIINYLTLPFFAYASAVVVPCLTTLISSYGGEDQKGVIMGIFRSLGSLARAFGPLLFSTIFWLFGDMACYGIATVSILLPLAMLRWQFKEKD